jgi:hypothetical protein
VQSGVRPGLEGVRVVDAATITSARMRDVPQQAPTQQHAAALLAAMRGNSGPLSLQSLQNCTPRYAYELVHLL